MASGHLSNDAFFTQLTSLLSSRQASNHGSIYLSQKRLSHSSPTTSTPSFSDPLADLHPPSPLPVLIRATNGKSKEHRLEGEKVKISTVVEADKLDGFFARYAECLKGGMGGLRKRDRSGRKQKDKAKKRKGKEGAGVGEKKR